MTPEMTALEDSLKRALAALYEARAESDRLRTRVAELEGAPPVPWTPFEKAVWPEPLRSKFEAEPGYVGVFRNSRYQVSVREGATDNEGGVVTWLSIVRLDREPIRDWRDFQRIKNELGGPEIQGLELYPRESRLVDTNNQYHIFLLPPGVELPFGYQTRDVSDRVPEGAVHKQRPFEDPPPDLNQGDGEKIYKKWTSG